MPSRYSIPLIVLFLFASPGLGEEKKANSVDKKGKQKVGAPKVDAPDKAEESPEWNVDSPPGPGRDQAIDTTEGTWISVDAVSYTHLTLPTKA